MAMRHSAAGLPETMIGASWLWSWQQHPFGSLEEPGETSPRLLAVKGRRAGKNLQGGPAIREGGWDQRELATTLKGPKKNDVRQVNRGSF
jgi:hypothetical protein